MGSITGLIYMRTVNGAYIISQAVCVCVFIGAAVWDGDSPAGEFPDSNG